MVKPATAGPVQQEVEIAGLGDGVGLFELIHRVGLAKSKTEARTLIRSGGVRVNDIQITDEKHLVYGGAKLSVGKKRHVFIR